MAWYDLLFVTGGVLVAVGLTLAWTTGRTILELVVGDDRREAVGNLLVRLGWPVLFVGAATKVFVEFS